MNDPLMVAVIITQVLVFLWAMEEADIFSVPNKFFRTLCGVALYYMAGPVGILLVVVLTVDMGVNDVA